MKVEVAVLVAVMMTATADAFTSRPTTAAVAPLCFGSISSSRSTSSQGKVVTSSTSALFSSSDPADLLSEYMIKSHEEKLRAIKSVEDKKNMEIAVSGNTTYC